MAKPIMVQGTASNAGKSIIATGLCRIFAQDGYTVAPFKSQNMSLNSFITHEGLEMGRAQVTQAEAAGIEPSVRMNPILLKPTGNKHSQIIVNGEVWANYAASDYYKNKSALRPIAQDAYDALSKDFDIIVLEGAGSPAEINLNTDDFVNMGMAKMADAPVVLVADIDRGGVFASIYGTVMLLDEEERARIKGIIINKFRGQMEILEPGIVQIEKLCRIPVLGVLPWLDIDIDDEDSLSSRLDRRTSKKEIDVAVIRFPHIANFSDLTALEQHESLGVRYVSHRDEIGQPDLLILPGSKNTMSDLSWLRQSGLESQIKKNGENGTAIIGICGGYQMLGMYLADPFHIEQGGTMRGLELLPIQTTFTDQKTRSRVYGTVQNLQGTFSPLSSARFEGYEIHMGQSERLSDEAFAILSWDDKEKIDGTVKNNVMGTYVHGLFDSATFRDALAQMLLSRKGIHFKETISIDYALQKEKQFDILAEAMREAIDMKAIYSILEIEGNEGVHDER